MCGICGIVGGTQDGLIERMTSAMIHRGPDDDGYYRNLSSGVELGMRRLSIIDLQTGKQPIFNEDGSIAIVFNGEIYNYRELAQSLKRQGHQFATASDTETIVHAYEQYGRDVVHHLRGMFAFALWDERRQQLLLARDRLGIKPLYYAVLPERFLFASEVKSLLQDASLPRRLNPRAICEYMLFGFLVGDEQPLAGVHMLSPGSYATFNRHTGLRVDQYWNPADIRPGAYSLAEGADRLAEVLEDAVASHLVADVEVGITLSGGLDSSLVLAIMARLLGQHAPEITAFTTGYGLPTDELPAARKTAARYGVSAQERLIPFDEAISVLPQVVWHVEEPLPHVTSFSTFFWSRFIRDRLKVVLVGEGADELFGGYIQYRLFDLPWRWMPTHVKRRLFRGGYLMPFVPEVKRLLNASVCPPEMVDEVYRSSYLGRLDGRRDLFDSLLLFELQTELPNSQLLRVDKLMMAHSVEARVPYLDHRVAELALSIPASLRRQRGVEKLVLRRAAEEYLPAETARKAKYGKAGSQPIMQELIRRGLSRCAERSLRMGQLNRHDIFDGGALAEYVHSEKTLPIWGTRIRDKFLIFALMLELWLRLFIDQPPPSGVPDADLYEALSVPRSEGNS
jgi:asparagine synthase (glutamine-hydrolysing)